jgi:5,6,7,8-tetrahydromethanopterin hydro-lyase
MLHVGEAFEGSGPNASHITLLLGPNAFLGNAFAVAAASPGPGHTPFQVVLKPNLAVRPPTLFVGKSALRSAQHERMTWGPAQAGVAVGITRAVIGGVLPHAADDEWLAIALVWVDPEANDADIVYRNNAAATLFAAERAIQTHGDDAGKALLARELGSVGNPFYTPPVA